jgi:hypothetical protein
MQAGLQVKMICRVAGAADLAASVGVDRTELVDRIKAEATVVPLQTMMKVGLAGHAFGNMRAGGGAIASTTCWRSLPTACPIATSPPGSRSATTR